MKLITTKDQINRHLPITGICANEGIYSLLYAKAEDNLTLGAGSSGVAQILVDFKADVMEPGECLLDAKLLKAIWPSIPEGEILWETRGGKLYISGQGGEWSVSIGDAEDYPLVSQDTTEISELSLVDLASAVNMVSFAIGDETQRPILNAINLNGGTFTATDGVKLSQVTTPIMDIDLTFSSSIKDIVQILTKITKSDEFRLNMGNTWVQLKSDTIEAWLATLGMEYPTTAINLIRDMQSTEPQASVLVEVREISPLIQAATALFNKSKLSDGLCLKIDNGLSLSLDGDAGSLDQTYQFEYTGAGEVWVNPTKFGEILRSSPRDSMDLRIYTDQKPIVGFTEDLPWGCALAVLNPPTRTTRKEEDESDF